MFDKKIMQSKTIKFYDISSIDYEYIEQLYDKQIPLCVINKKFGHERINSQNYYNKYIYDLNIDDYINYNVDLKYFYNDTIKENIYNFYINDFILFKENGIDYTTQF